MGLVRSITREVMLRLFMMLVACPLDGGSFSDKFALQIHPQQGSSERF